MKLHPMTEHYLIAALWSSADNNDEPFDANYSIDDFTKRALKKADADCMTFLDKAASLLDNVDFEQAGHDFWLTRNEHGTGFWDRGLGITGDKLTDLAHSFGQASVFTAGKGKVAIQ